jgi:hypothetical protein
MSRLKSLLAVLPPLEIPSPPSPLSTFTLFPKLAPEIRDMIFSFACLQPRKVNLLSTFSDPAPRLISTIPGQSRQPAIMEVCWESRSVGKRFYTLVTSIPRKRCIKREGAACLRCIYDAWNAAPERGYWKQRWKDEDLQMLPVEIRERVRGEVGWIPAHETEVDAGGDLHLVNFEIDGFVLKLSSREREHFSSRGSPRDLFWISAGEVVAKIKSITVLTEPGWMETSRLSWTLGNILKRAHQLQEINLNFVWRMQMVKACSYVSLELAHTRRCAHVNSSLMRGACKEAKDKLIMKWAFSNEDENGGDSLYWTYKSLRHLWWGYNCIVLASSTTRSPQTENTSLILG